VNFVALVVLILSLLWIVLFLDKRSRFILLCFLLFNSLYALNRGEIRSIVRDLVKDASSDPAKQHWSDSEINQYINLAQQEIVSLTWCQQNYYDLTISSHYRVYTITDTVFTITRITVGSKAILETSFAELDRESSYWDVSPSSSTPTKYYIYQSSGTNLKIGFYPPPEKNYNVRIYYIENATDMDDDSDIPFRGIKKLYPYHYLICLWTASQLSAMDENSAMASFYYKLYLDRIVDMQKTINYKPNYFPTISGERE